jgi:hypothetical protein
MSTKFDRQSAERLSPEEIEQWRQLKKTLDSMNQWEKRQRIQDSGKMSVQNKLNEYFDLMDFLLDVAPKESERAYSLRMLHLIDLQNKFVIFERWRNAKQVNRSA